MYHDQALIPVKLFGFHDAINITWVYPSFAPRWAMARALTSRVEASRTLPALWLRSNLLSLPYEK